MENDKSLSPDALITDLCSKVESYLTGVLPEASKAYDFEFSDHSLIGEYISRALQNIADASDSAMSKNDLDLIIESAINGFRKAWSKKYPNCLFGDAALRLRREELYQISILAVFNENKDTPNNVIVESEASSIKEKVAEVLGNS